MKHSRFLPLAFVLAGLITHGAATDAAPAPLTPDFSAVVVKGGGLWPQIQTAPDGTLLALGYNAAAHTTLPGDVDAWASSDGGKTWSLRATAAARPAKSANYCHWASGISAKGSAQVVLRTVALVLKYLKVFAGLARDGFEKVIGSILYDGLGEGLSNELVVMSDVDVYEA